MIRVVAGVKRGFVTVVRKVITFRAHGQTLLYVERCRDCGWLHLHLKGGDRFEIACPSCKVPRGVPILSLDPRECGSCGDNSAFTASENGRKKVRSS